MYCNNFRDSIQAKNILNIISAEHPEKMIIYSGFDHINKTSNNEWKKTIEHLMRKSSLRILSIDQSRMGNCKIGQNDYFNTVIKKYGITEPAVLVHNDSVYRTNPNQFDVQVFFPKTQDWYKNMYFKYDLLIDAKYLNCGLYLFNRIEYQAIPAKYNRVNSTEITLSLPGKSYDFIIMNSEGYILKSGKIASSKYQILIR